MNWWAPSNSGNSGSLKRLRILSGYCPKLPTFNIKPTFKKIGVSIYGEMCHRIQSWVYLKRMLRLVSMNTKTHTLGIKMTGRNCTAFSHTKVQNIKNMEKLTCPGFPFSHKKASCSDANSGALSFTSRTLIAMGTRDTWLWFPKKINQSIKGKHI